jgi:hypothetical protein
MSNFGVDDLAVILILCVGIVCGYIICLGTTNHADAVDISDLNNLKTDCYVSGLIDGRASILEEQSTTGYKHERLGIPEGYISNRTSEWRGYADYVAGITDVAYYPERQTDFVDKMVVLSP